MSVLTPRWSQLRYHPEQNRCWKNTARFYVNPAGRRSGKTELLKRRAIVKALRARHVDWWGILAAPTHLQAKRIFWRDIKALVPDRLIRDKSESELTLTFVHGPRLSVMGLDAPERVEGSPLDFAGVDEFGNMKPETWGEHLRPALSTPGRPPGEAAFIGVPEGRNHYYDLARRAQADTTGVWAYYHWVSADILDPEEIKQAKHDLDDLTFQQEYEGSFVMFTGRTYYPFAAATHTEPLEYDPRADLVFAFDFNVSPGVAAVIQEQEYGGRNRNCADHVSGVIGEVWIPRNSNTQLVCSRLVTDWGKHKGRVLCYGDATGGARGTAKTSGTDWELIEAALRPTFRDQLHFEVPKANPSERARVNAVNSRLCSADGTVSLLVDGEKAPRVVLDLEGVRCVEGGSGEIDKKADKTLSHISDALGYYVVREFPIDKGGPLMRRRIT